MKKYFFLFVVSIVTFFFHAVVTKHAIYGDGNGYYAYANALYFERSLNFEPIYSHLSNFQGTKYNFSRISWPTDKGPFGIQRNIFMIGTGIAWIPSLLAIDIVGKIFVLELSRFDLIYELGPGVSGIIFMLFGFFFLEKYLKNFFSERAASLAVLIFYLTSNSVYYTMLEPALSHQPAFFIISYLLYKTHNLKPKSINPILIGFLAGFLFITRMADIILVIPILFQVKKDGWSFKKMLLSAAGFTVALIPLFWSQYLMYGNPIHNPYVTGENGGSFIFALRHMSEFFISAKRGLFLWHPIYLIAMMGLFSSIFDNKTRKIGILLVIPTLIIFLISSAWSANTSAGFGQRYVLAGIPYFAFGIAALIERVKSKHILAFSSILIIWNALTIFQFYFDPKNLLDNEKLTATQFLRGQFNAPIKAYRIITKKGGGAFFFNQILN